MRLFSNMLTFNRVKDGEDGKNGINGTNGIDGSSQYFHVKYSKNASGNPMQTSPSTYIGTFVSDNPQAPSDYQSYNWIRLEGAQGKDGEDGIPGKNGEDGKTSYLHIKYSNDGETFTENNGETPGSWMGQYVDFEEKDSSVFYNYKWKKVDGEDGKQGPMPINAGLYNSKTRYVRDEDFAPFVYKFKTNGQKEYYLLLAKESQGVDPLENNTHGSGDVWRRKEFHDLLLARKIRADEIDVDNLVVRKVKTANSGARFEMEGSEMKVYGDGVHPNMIFGVNKDGYAVMEYYTPAGDKLYDLGPSGINMLDFAPVKWTEKKLKQFSTEKSRENITSQDFYKIINGNVTQTNSPIYYNYYAGGNPTVSQEEREREKYTYASINGPKIADGWYYTPPRANDRGYMQYPSNNSGNFIKPEAGGLYNDSYGVVDRSNIYIVKCHLYLGGILTDSANYYFQENPKNDGGGMLTPDR